MKDNLPPWWIGAGLAGTGCAGLLVMVVPGMVWAVLAFAALVVAFVVFAALWQLDSGRVDTERYCDPPEETTAGRYAAELNRFIREQEAETTAAEVILDEPLARPDEPQNKGGDQGTTPTTTGAGSISNH